jgi:superfamily II DNA or RNA helicase
MIQLREHQIRIIDKMNHHQRGQVIVPTGGGKTICMISDAISQFSKKNQTIVVVSPRILLTQQLSSDFLELLQSVEVLHVHSGETPHDSTTDKREIFNWTTNKWNSNKIIFTTYHSLHRIQESGIPVDTIYFDEAHNSVQQHFHPATRFFATTNNRRCFFFTATPRISNSDEEVGMNNEYVYGKVLEQVPAPELVNKGYILPPKVVIKQLEMIRDRKANCDDDADNILKTIDEQNVSKILICARRTAQITNMVSDSKLTTELYARGYNWMYITAKTGAVINGIKVSREDFFTTLNAWGKEDDRKFIVMHHSILSEGVNVSGLEAALLLRNMDFITISQTIGRVIRKGNEQKQFGIVCVPVYDKVGISTSKSVNAVVDTVFNRGQSA